MDKLIKKLEKELENIEYENNRKIKPHPIYGYQEVQQTQLKNSKDKELIQRLLDILKR